MGKARKEIEFIVAEQRLKLPRKPRAMSMMPFGTPPGSEVYVHSEKKKCWKVLSFCHHRMQGKQLSFISETKLFLSQFHVFDHFWENIKQTTKRKQNHLLALVPELKSFGLRTISTMEEKSKITSKIP